MSSLSFQLANKAVIDQTVSKAHCKKGLQSYAQLSNDLQSDGLLSDGLLSDGLLSDGLLSDGLLLKSCGFFE